MKKGDHGYERLLGEFKRFYCRHDMDGPLPLIDGCTHREKAFDGSGRPDCPHQTGWDCHNDKNPGNIRLADLVMDNL